MSSRIIPVILFRVSFKQLIIWVKKMKIVKLQVED